jgi:hypothetical protein
VTQPLPFAAADARREHHQLQPVTFRALRRRLDESLFPADPVEGQGSKGETAIVLLAFAALGIVLQLLRPGWTASLESLWAEDGTIFLQGALSQGFVDAVLTPYAGYLVLVPRLIGEGAVLVPLGDAAAAVSILSAAVVVVSGIAVWFAAAGHIRNPWLRGTLACLTVLAPVAGLESVDSAAYVPWYMLFATFWLLLWRPRTTVAAVLAGLFILVTGLSSPGLWFFAPLAALRALAIRDRRDLAIVGGFAVGALSQVPVLAFNQEQAVTPSWTSDIWIAYAQRVVDGALLGEHLGGEAWVHFGRPFLFLLLFVTLATLFVLARNSTATGRWLAAIAIPTSLLLFIVSAYQRAVGSEIMWPLSVYHGAAGRYAIVPALLLVSAGFALLDGWLSNSSGPSRRVPAWTAVAAVALLWVGIASSFDLRDEPIRGTPPWEEALQGAAAECSAGDITDASVPTSPPGFGMSLPCERVLEDTNAKPASAAAASNAARGEYEVPGRGVSSGV